MKMQNESEQHYLRLKEKMMEMEEKDRGIIVSFSWRCWEYCAVNKVWAGSHQIQVDNVQALWNANCNKIINISHTAVLRCSLEGFVCALQLHPVISAKYCRVPDRQQSLTTQYFGKILRHYSCNRACGVWLELATIMCGCGVITWPSYDWLSQTRL